MIDINSLFIDSSKNQDITLSKNISLIDDLTRWCDLFNMYLKKEEASQNTILSYNDVLKALLEYSSIYLPNNKNIQEFDEVIFNDFLSWIENYTTNKLYGSPKERVAKLLKFIDFAKSKGIDDIVEAREAYFKNVENDFENINYAIDEFEGYYYRQKVDILSSIDKGFMLQYIEQLPRASVTTMMHRRAVLHKFFSYISKQSGTNCFEVALSNIKKYKKQKGNIHKSKAIDEEIVQKLLAFIDDYTKNPKKYLLKEKNISQYIAYRNTGLILLMMGAGCRASEALSLKYKDIIDDNEHTYKIYIIGGKGNKNRTSYISKRLFRNHYEYLFGRNHDEDSFISLNINGQKTNRKMLYAIVKEIFSKMGVDKKGLHIFRHHFGTNFAEKNGNIKLLQDLLGHANISTTMIYSNTGEKAKEDAISKLENNLL